MRDQKYSKAEGSPPQQPQPYSSNSLFHQAFFSLKTQLGKEDGGLEKVRCSLRPHKHICTPAVHLHGGEGEAWGGLDSVPEKWIFPEVPEIQKSSRNWQLHINGGAGELVQISNTCVIILFALGFGSVFDICVDAKGLWSLSDCFSLGPGCWFGVFASSIL